MIVHTNMMKLILPFAVALAFITTNAFGVSLPLLPWQNADHELLTALQDRNLARFEALLKKGANPNAFFVTKRGDDEWVMCDATNRRTLEFLKLALKYGGNANLHNPDDYSFSRPIYCALIKRNVEAVYLLADHGADLATQDLGNSTPLVNAADSALWDVVYWMLKQREGQISDREMEGVIRNIESGDGSLHPNTDNNVWRFRVLEYLTAKGYQIKPYMGEMECRLGGRRRQVVPRPCREANAKPGDIIYLEDPNLHRQDWERAKAGGPRPEPRE
jgi:hypothetical protein